ncbi:unnamed protein product [Rotaria sp. Silwood2]|nr:unnamed protein product [Rotaria sp. Silwood2]CAF2529904.1 unnamed protein product [Rotaria sp. Silwood2]CAF4046472.1 unnamed protein product [Rotaria sp. Silwood2]
MDYPPQMHHQAPFPCKPPPHHSQNPIMSNHLQPMNSASHTTMWLDDSYSGSTVCPSQRDSGFNSRPASLRSIESTSTGPMHHGSPSVYEHNPSRLSNDLENTHPQYTELQPAPPPAKLPPAQVIPELLNLLMEDDSVIVREAVLLTHMLIREGGESRSEVIRNRELINTLLETFSKYIGDGKIIHALASLFYSLSQQQEGLRVILDCGGISRLISILDSPDETVKFVVTILHNFLIVFQDQASSEIERCDGIEKFIHLLERPNDKLLTLVSDSLLKMSIYNVKSKIFVQNNEQCIERLLCIFDACTYDKLLLIISKLLPIISSGNEVIKRTILQLNGLNIFEKHLRTTKSIRIRHNCLITIRNISNQATRMRDIDSLIQKLVAILSTDDQQSVICSLGILSNLTADNRANKSLFFKLNGVQTLMQKLLMNADGNNDLIEVVLCTLRHVTARHDLENEARETIRKSYGIGNIIKLLRDKNFKEHWGILKATVGVIKNLALSSTIIPYLCEQNAVRRLIELLIIIDRERLKISEDNKLDILLDNIIGALINLTKDSSCRSIIKEMNCTSIFIRFSHLPSCTLQQSSNTLLNELNID